MRIVYLGNNDRGVKCLEALLADRRDVAGVVAHPDPDVKPWYASVKETALAAGIPVIQPVKVADEIDTLRRWEPDLLILAGYTQIIPSSVLGVPKRGAINLHGGKLPEYRGASVMNWQIINGETEGGVCILKVDEGIDTGDVLSQERFRIGADDTIRDVLDTTLTLFPEMLVRVLKELDVGAVQGVPQDPAEGRTWPKRRGEDGALDFNTMTAADVHNMIRALTRPYPGAFASLDGRRVFFWESRLREIPNEGKPGAVLAVEGPHVVIACAEGAVLVGDCTHADGEAVVPPVGARLT